MCLGPVVGMARHVHVKARVRQSAHCSAAPQWQRYETGGWKGSLGKVPRYLWYCRYACMYIITNKSEYPQNPAICCSRSSSVFGGRRPGHLFDDAHGKHYWHAAAKIWSTFVFRTKPQGNNDNQTPPTVLRVVHIRVSAYCIYLPYNMMTGGLRHPGSERIDRTCCIPYRFY